MTRRTKEAEATAAEPLPCLFCERQIKPLEPTLATNFAIPGESRIGYVPAHMACLIEAIAGETARAVLYAIQSGEVDVGLAHSEGAEVNDMLTGIVARLVEKHL